MRPLVGNSAAIAFLNLGGGGGPVKVSGSFCIQLHRLIQHKQFIALNKMVFIIQNIIFTSE